MAGGPGTQNTHQIAALNGQILQIIRAHFLVQQIMDQGIALVLPVPELIQQAVLEIGVQAAGLGAGLVLDEGQLGTDVGHLLALHVGFPKARMAQDGFGAVLQNGVLNENGFQVEFVFQGLVQPFELLFVVVILLLTGRNRATK